MVQAKKCRDCGETKPAAEFWKRKASADGLSLYCRACFGIRNSASYRDKRAAEGKSARPYRRLRDTPDGMKYCPQCDETKPIAEFGKNRARSTGLTNYCRPCHSRVSDEAKRRLYGSQRSYLLQLRYGLTEAQVDEMIAGQGGICVLCLRDPAVHVDHDHSTGAVRSILCFRCNGGLGQFDDNPRRLYEAADYLEKRTWYVRLLRLELGTAQITSSALRAWREETYPGFANRRRAEILLREGLTSRGQLRLRCGLDAADVDDLQAIQQDVCAICVDGPAEHVDHCHETLAVRGLLCGGCNTGMGQLRDDPAVLRRAIDYVLGLLVREVPDGSGGTRLSFTEPDVDPATVPQGGWERHRLADAAFRKEERDREGVRDSWIADPVEV
ncbi:endonuclease VII domain-containing protein [Actinomadura rubteroloni]|nr:endonuclease VII domain-containing protein [Actinomadura rubteroloni]